MNNILDKFLNFRTLLAVNLVIAFLAETMGGGRFFQESGMIHIAAITFIFLAILLIIIDNQKLYFRGFLHLILGALLFLSATHVVEFLGEQVFHLSETATGAFVIAGYVISFLLMILGYKDIDKVYNKKIDHTFDFAILIFVTAIFSALSIFILVGGESLIDIGLVALAVFLSSIFFGMIAAQKFIALGEVLPLMKDFTCIMVASIILSITSGAFEYLEIYSVPDSFISIQASYFSHFALFAAISIMIVAFIKLKNLSKQK